MALKFNIGDKVEVDPNKAEVDTFLHTCIGRVATVQTVGIGWFKLKFDDNGWQLQIAHDMFKHINDLQ